MRERVLAAWCDLAGTDAEFVPGQITVIPAPGSRFSPPGWVGAVHLLDTAMITTPTDATADRVRRAVAGLEPGRACDPALLAPVQVLGPATLAYVDAASFRPATSSTSATGRTSATGVTSIPAGPEIDALESAVSQADRDECGISEITSPAFVTRSADGAVSAACGYRIWPGGLAHMCALTRTDQRGRGLAQAVASAATAHAIEAGLLPQWRARPAESRAVARAVGYLHYGEQLSVRLSD